MDKFTKKQLEKTARLRRVRAKITGTDKCPRVSVNKTARHFSAQAIDDIKGTTLASITSKSKGFESKNTGIKLANELGEAFGSKLKEAGMTTIVFDRGSHRYHGRVKAFADAMRKSGIKF